MLTGNGGRDHGAGRLSLLALLFDEPGAQTVADAVVDGTMVSAGNLAEVATVLLRYDRGARPVRAQGQVTDADALAVASLHPQVSAKGCPSATGPA